jgi:hypothetical protein
MIRRFNFRQTLVGSYRPVGDTRVDRPLALTLVAARPRLLPPASGKLDVIGEIDAPGIADNRPLSGTLEARRFRLGVSRYDLQFDANDGARLTLRAARDPSLRQPLLSLSRVMGAILDEDGRTLWDVELRLDYRDSLSRLLLS